MKHTAIRVGMGLFAGLLSLGCQSGGHDTSPTAETGTLGLPLKTNGPSGTEYRLRDANFQIWGYNDFGYTDEVVSSETDPTAQSIAVSLEQGYYDIYLNAGWRMEKVTNGVAETVDALLLSSSYQYAYVSPHSTSWVSYQFGIGDRKIWLNGSLNIEMQVFENPEQYYGGGPGTLGEELIALDVIDTGWVAGDTNAASIQGAFYSFGDQVACAPPDGNPCGPAGCCIPYTTILDATYAAWGCGIGLELNSTGESISGENDSVKRAYAGKARGLAVTVSNSGTARLRLSYTQSWDTTGRLSPFVDLKEGTTQIQFTDVQCPSWDTDGKCQKASPNPYDVQLQVIGAEGESAGELCITSIRPMY